MSLRTRAGAGPNAGSPPPSSFTPHSTFPQRNAYLPPSSRGPLLFALGHAYRPLAERDLRQLAAARTLAPELIAPGALLTPLGEGTAARSFRPLPVDRGFRRPYFIPPTPGSSSSSGPGGPGDPGGACDGC